jgi:hypothetical protein
VYKEVLEKESARRREETSYLHEKRKRLKLQKLRRPKTSGTRTQRERERERERGVSKLVVSETR